MSQIRYSDLIDTIRSVMKNGKVKDKYTNVFSTTNHLDEKVTLQYNTLNHTFRVIKGGYKMDFYILSDALKGFMEIANPLLKEIIVEFDPNNLPLKK